MAQSISVNAKGLPADRPHYRLEEGMKETHPIRVRMNCLLWVAVFIGSTLLAQSPPAPTPQAQPPQSGRQTLGSSGAAQSRITREVRHELLLLGNYNVFDWLAYKVEGYNVTLYGQVTQPSLKSDAENAVKRIEGVEQVDNRIEVLPPSPDDDRLRREEYNAIYGYDGLSRYAWGPTPSIHIIVKNGHVTLVGVVDSQADKDMAEIRAKGVPGVFSVTNNLVVGSSR
jgi:hyperosmotically inducible periplasmic protein